MKSNTTERLEAAEEIFYRFKMVSRRVDLYTKERRHADRLEQLVLIDIGDLQNSINGENVEGNYYVDVAILRGTISHFRKQIREWANTAETAKG